jgi:glycosyltransferase involved in cell wall biosynthesis
MSSSEDALPLVAIVTPVYNGSPWLERTMACVQRQTYGNLVHVLLDNASTDDTPEVIERFRDQKVRLQVTRNAEVLSQTANWNAAMKLVPADAKYVMLLCSDDLIRSDAVERLVGRAEEDQEIVLVTAPDVVFDRVRAPLPPDGKSIVDGKDFVRAFLKNTYNHFAWQLFFARWHPEHASEDYFSYSDATLDTMKLLRVMMTGKVGFVMEPLFYTRHHTGNMSAQFTAKRNPNFRLFRWEPAVQYASKLLDPGDAQRVMQEEKYLVLRFELAWRRAGASVPANALRKRLASDGFPPTWLDYVRAIVTYPFYKMRQSKISRAANHRWPQAITEADFIAQ